MNEKGDTKSRILDAAEKLFGMNGFEGTSLRDITAEAQVNLAAVNYHFQSKDSLIDAVIARRIEPVNGRRFEMLEAAGANPTVEQILTAFLAPVFEQTLDAVVPLMGRIMSNPSQFVERVFKAHLAHVARRFGEELGRALPGIPPVERAWRLYFTGGIMAYVLNWSQVFPEISGGLCDITDRKALVERIVAFAAAGFRAAATAHGMVQEPALERKG